MKKLILMAGLMAMPALVIAADSPSSPMSGQSAASKRLAESDRKVTAGRILLKWGGYVEKVNGQDRKAWAAALWPSLASADLDNLQKASRAVTYEGMRNALLGQRPYDDQIIDRMAKSGGGSANVVTKALGSLASDLVFTPITPCRIVDTRVTADRIGAGATRDLDASNFGGNFTSQGGAATNCGIPANPAALALSVTGLSNTSTGYLRIYPYDGTNTQGSPVPLNTINTTVTNDMIVPTCQGCTQELKVFSTANTHYAAFVTGYFMAPLATALSTTLASRDDNVLNGETLQFFIGCPAGYSLTGGGCYSDDLYLIGNTDFGGAHYCKFRNLSGITQSARSYATCSRVPGR